jgi:hypothetical protein
MWAIKQWGFAGEYEPLDIFDEELPEKQEQENEIENENYFVAGME